MARRNRTTQIKREREQKQRERQQKKMEKLAKREERRLDRNASGTIEAVDPQIQEDADNLSSRAV